MHAIDDTKDNDKVEGHATQVVDPTAELYVPAVQLAHMDTDSNPVPSPAVPAGQSVQIEEPIPDVYKPAGQLTHEELTLDPEKYVPRGQLAQSDAPRGKGHG